MWDECIRNAVNGRVYAFSWYLDIMAENWDALIAGEGNYESVFPLTYRTKFGVNYLYQPFFTQQLGLFSCKKLTPELVDMFLEAIPKKFLVAEINLNTLNKPDPTKWNVFDNINYELDLIEPFESIYKRFSSNTRRNVGRAEQKEIKVSDTVNPDEIIKLFRQNRGASLMKLKDTDYRKLLQLIYHGIHKQIAFSYGAYTSTNTLCAGMIIFISHHKATFLFSATNAEARESGAMSMLISQFIYSAAGNHLTLDFEGSNDPQLGRFYKSFGAQKITYPSITINRLPFPLRHAFKVYKKFRLAGESKESK
jgi:lipid II:glycine glycyltransferase (peptidoglycan interpeptide bridge formation enzyme)